MFTALTKILGGLRMPAHGKKLSRRERIRAVLKNVALKQHEQVILTRAEIIKLCKPGWGEEQHLSMTLSRMKDVGEVATYPLLGKRGFVLTNYHA